MHRRSRYVESVPPPGAHLFHFAGFTGRDALHAALGSWIPIEECPPLPDERSTGSFKLLFARPVSPRTMQPVVDRICLAVPGVRRAQDWHAAKQLKDGSWYYPRDRVIFDL